MKIELTFTTQQMADTICAGIEGGIRYWCPSFSHSDLPVPEAEIPADEVARRVMCHYAQPALEGGWLDFVEERSEQGEPNVTHRVDRSAILRAIAVIAEKYPHHLAAVLGLEDGDATTGDVLIQCACFGELVYG